MKTVSNMRAVATLIWLLIGSGLVASTAWAEDRALLIGVGKYRLPGNDLPGIDLDIGMVEEMAELMGFADRQVKVMMDEQATLANVEQTMATWLVEEVVPDDRILIYFSGHGTRIPDENGDENDAADEVLTMHDTAPDQRNGRATLKNVLVDDRFNELLAGIPSRNVLVLVDACHSGTSTKQLALSPRAIGETTGYAKFYHYAGIPPAYKGNFGAEQRPGSDADNHVTIAAAGDDEQSIATPKGSLFTLGMRQTIGEAARGNQAPTPDQVRAEVEQFILARLSGERVFHPQVSGDPELVRKPLQLAATRSGHGPVWRKLVAVVQEAEPLSVTINQQDYTAGDVLVISVDIEHEGYLNVVNVGSRDEPTVLFPNKFHQDNRVAPGRVTVPTERMDFDLVAGEPFGPSLVAAFLTRKPVNLYESGNGERDQKGELVGVFSTLSELGVRSFQVQQKTKGGVSAGMFETRVCPDRDPC